MSLSITPTAMRRVAAAVEMYARNRGLCGDAIRRCQDRAMRSLREGEGSEAAIVAGKQLALRVSGFRV